MTWEPILDGDLAVAARSAADDVAQALAAGAGVRRTPEDLALFWAYYAGANDNEWSAAHYEAAVDELCTSATTTRHLHLHGGLSGAGWVLAHISEPGVADDFLVTLDTLLVEALAAPQWTQSYDLISGLVGHGVYFLERAASGSAARAGLQRVVELLRATSRATPDGVTWLTAPEILPEWQRALSPAGHFDCGVAHGVPGPIAVLGRIAAEPEAPAELRAEARALCESALHWLARQRLPAGADGIYPWSIVDGEPPTRPARTAWCYGDPGIALTALGASLRLGAPADAWRELAGVAAARPFDRCGVDEPGLCHGAAGLAHIYNRCYQATGDAQFRAAARAWIERALAGRQPAGLAGFSCRSREEGEHPRIPAADLLEGATGVGLVLLAALEPVEPAWDRLILCDTPAAPGARG